MMFQLLLFAVLSHAVIHHIHAANQSRFNQENTFNVHQLIMNYIIGDAYDNKVLNDGAPEKGESHSVETENGHQVMLDNSILEQVNLNGNRTTRAFETLAREMKSLATHQQTILGAINEIADQESGDVKETTFNETMRRVQSDLGLLVESVRNLSKPDAQAEFPTDCNDVSERGFSATGVYTVQPRDASKPSRVRCEMDGTPWTVLMRRFDGSVSFNRTWNEYKYGFGNPAYEFWVGNEFMHYLTTQRAYKARFDMKLWDTGATSYSVFTLFRVGNESSGYQLSIGGESGTADRGRMAMHNHMKFSTKDRDNDKSSSRCAVTYNGAWWFSNCYNVHFTGMYENRCLSQRCNHWSRNKALREMSIRVTRI